ncbi:hypothetical protein CEXT_218201 [Caerostris extrusa]|uniref:Uncharacterized protein n=1 Tax=Caerostris extrusa TaxID=172846 RepID=A0AAV4Y2N5_CAEEX|nr:hypothetical protein CEXT_218201 [Caerostris extrusa]
MIAPLSLHTGVCSMDLSPVSVMKGVFDNADINRRSRFCVNNANELNQTFRNCSTFVMGRTCTSTGNKRTCGSGLISFLMGRMAMRFAWVMLLIGNL